MMTERELIDRIEILEDEVRALREIIDRTIAVPYEPSTAPPSTPGYLWPQLPQPTKPQCSACGLVLHEVMGYVCSRVPCPSGLGGPLC